MSITKNNCFLSYFKQVGYILAYRVQITNQLNKQKNESFYNNNIPDDLFRDLCFNTGGTKN